MGTITIKRDKQKLHIMHIKIDASYWRSSLSNFRMMCFAMAILFTILNGATLFAAVLCYYLVARREVFMTDGERRYVLRF